MKTLSDRMHAALIAAGKTQADLVRATGAKSSSVANWVGGRTKNLRGENLVIVSRLLNVSEAWLGAGVGPRERFKAGSWPLRSISPEQWETLPQGLRDQAESYIGYLLERHASGESPDTSLNKSTAKPLKELGAELQEVKARLRHNVTKDKKVDVLETEARPQRKRASGSTRS
ncbi:hypothetical protein LP085_30330 [Achromobacter sp. MY14]|uniref:hypothetical protein n=1 Tax=unclassified Achromobacter TaxID=2626865 RepID=UPI001E56CC5D|nr:hypothetical protein [Achromobacter sp. MY14]MCD0501183.1 hypothetical protein [Achromobacter sp. MY14]